MKLENLRIEMDEIDGEIIRLLNDRAKIARKIGVVKAQAGLPIVDLDREAAILRRVCAENNENLTSDALERIYKRIITESRRLQVENVGKLAEIYQ
ncbi:MAG TPA: chorismate mutase [Pyrinomonadaceae bacterium]|nr:chorismate mutase [Pyrinomonadaceae bacterium]